ncbi:hypothetical protein EVAR_22507_1 [Eumeta japonica]|uniref:Uncharacterized protein n=1 Tax=Eumeta variegata TaxID=151549 RepID=A0A4C1ZA52_EUMVA|nr:hypothetical protein EVAR_22507_1 [Eumeta japonica]
MVTCDSDLGVSPFDGKLFYTTISRSRSTDGSVPIIRDKKASRDSATDNTSPIKRPPADPRCSGAADRPTISHVVAGNTRLEELIAYCL